MTYDERRPGHPFSQKLRRELNSATKRQIDAEFLLHTDGDSMGVDTMTDAEMGYLTAMEEVKTISKQLVQAEQAFSLVRDRVQELVNRYQALLVKIESESCAGASSIITYESSRYSDHDSLYWEEQNMIEKQKWARRARRTEIRAGLAARETLAAKEEARMIEKQKQRELDDLRQKLMELQSDPSSSHFSVGREGSMALTRNFADQKRTRAQQANTGGHGGVDKAKLEGVKQRFRDRIAAKKKLMSTKTNNNEASGTYIIEKPRTSEPVAAQRKNFTKGSGRGDVLTSRLLRAFVASS